MAKHFYVCWISRIGVQEQTSTEQSRQFDSQLFNSESRYLGTDNSHTTQSRMEVFYRSLRQSIRCLTSVHWTVLLGLRTTFEDTASCAELVHHTTFRLPGKFMHPSVSNIDPNAHTLQQLKNSVLLLRALATKENCAKTVLVHKNLQVSIMCLLDVMPPNLLLHTTFQGHTRCWLEIKKKTFKILVNDKGVVISTDCLKPAFFFMQQMLQKCNLPRRL